MSRVEALLKAMTLKEKIGQLNQRLYGWQVFTKTKSGIELTDYFKNEVARWGSLGVLYGVFRADPWSGKDQHTGLNRIEAKEVSELIQDYLRENTRLKIPVLLSEECPHGHQALDSLTTPVNFTVGSSWNPEKYQLLQEMVGAEIREKGAHLGLISTLDILRDPRWGRSEECFSEDPLLASCFTEAAVLGLQKKDRTGRPNIIAVLKHLAGQGNVMGGHNAAPVNIGARELKEIHLPAVASGVKAGALAVMAAYNDIDGIPCHANEQLLKTYLRSELGFLGAVMTDGCALERLSDIAGDPVKAAARAINSGIDISLWDNVFPHLEAAVTTRLVDETTLDAAVLRVLKLKEILGLFAPKKTYKAIYTASDKHSLCLSMAEEAIVLLKNTGVLPIARKENIKISLVGPHIENVYHQLGDYTPFKDITDCCTIVDGMQQALRNSPATFVYHQGCTISDEIEDRMRQAFEQSKSADVIVITLGGSSARDFATSFAQNGAALTGANDMTSGENIDVASLDLPNCQLNLLKKLAELHKPLIGILIAGRPHSIDAAEPYLDAILWAGYPGQYGGEAIANILFGKNPSGRLAFSLPRASGQLPVYYNYRNTNFKADYANLSGKPAYAFGFGLSYTAFFISACAITKSLTNGLAVTVQIKNAGAIAGSEVIQIYGRKKQEFIVPRVKELLGFLKVQLQPQEEKEVTIAIQNEYLSYLDENFQKKLPSELTIMVASSSYYKSEHVILTS